MRFVGLQAPFVNKLRREELLVWEFPGQVEEQVVFLAPSSSAQALAQSQDRVASNQPGLFRYCPLFFSAGPPGLLSLKQLGVLEFHLKECWPHLYY